jgi:glycosyltransferase involved in cell wall biosynthesis
METDRKKILYVVHNHPAIRPGGCEAYALELYEAMRDSSDFDAVFLARSGPPVSVTSLHHEGRPITLVNEDPNQYFFYTDLSDWEWHFGRSPRKSTLTRFFREFLLDIKPDVVHFQHTIFLGYDILRVTRNALPHVPIVYTLHEFLPICYADGKLLRTMNDEPCLEASPRRCHECFPQITQQTFFMRERFIKSHLSLVDRFIAPSRFLMDRYLDWGIPPEKIMFEDYGRLSVARHEAPAPNGAVGPAARDDRPRNRFAFFGQLTQYKGIDVLLKAMAVLADEGFDAHLSIHGANLDWAPTQFQDKLRALLAEAGGTVTLVGQYEPEDLPQLMEEIDWVVVPSIWWENSPLVIQEASQYGRPVICSDIGGMAEKVADGVNGLHFRRGDPDSLAETMCRAVETNGLWNELSLGIQPVLSMSDHVATLTELYESLLDAYGARTRPGDEGQVVQLA